MKILEDFHYKFKQASNLFKRKKNVPYEDEDPEFYNENVTINALKNMERVKGSKLAK